MFTVSLGIKMLLKYKLFTSIHYTNKQEMLEDLFLFLNNYTVLIFLRSETQPSQGLILLITMIFEKKTTF